MWCVWATLYYVKVFLIDDARIRESHAETLYQCAAPVYSIVLWYTIYGGYTEYSR